MKRGILSVLEGETIGCALLALVFFFDYLLGLEPKPLHWGLFAIFGVIGFMSRDDPFLSIRNNTSPEGTEEPKPPFISSALENLKWCTIATVAISATIAIHEIANGTYLFNPREYISLALAITCFSLLITAISRA